MMSIRVSSQTMPLDSVITFGHGSPSGVLGSGDDPVMLPPCEL